MGRGDSRHTMKMKRREARKAKKAREKRKALAKQEQAS